MPRRFPGAAVAVIFGPARGTGPCAYRGEDIEIMFTKPCDYFRQIMLFFVLGDAWVCGGERLLPLSFPGGG